MTLIEQIELAQHQHKPRAELRKELIEKRIEEIRNELSMEHEAGMAVFTFAGVTDIICALAESDKGRALLRNDVSDLEYQFTRLAFAISAVKAVRK